MLRAKSMLRARSPCYAHEVHATCKKSMPSARNDVIPCYIHEGKARVLRILSMPLRAHGFPSSALARGKASQVRFLYPINSPPLRGDRENYGIHS